MLDCVEIMCREAHKSSREYIYTVMNLDETHIQIRLNLVEIYAIIRKRSTNLDELMYDDYDLDYTISNDYNLDEDAYYEYGASDLDDDYARDGQDYQDLAYRHYA